MICSCGFVLWCVVDDGCAVFCGAVSFFFFCCGRVVVVAVADSRVTVVGVVDFFWVVGYIILL